MAYLTPAYYPNKAKLYEELNRVLQPWNCNFTVVKESEEWRIQLTTMLAGHHMVLKNGLRYVLGFKEEELRATPYTAVYDADLSRGNFAMFIYCDMVEPLLVGDSMVPLLRTTHLTSTEYGAIVNQVFNPPLYVSIGKTLVNTIEIDIRTDTGDPFPLTKDGKVILILHVKYDK